METLHIFSVTMTQISGTGWNAKIESQNGVGLVLRIKLDYSIQTLKFGLSSWSLAMSLC